MTEHHYLRQEEKNGIKEEYLIWLKFKPYSIDKVKENSFNKCLSNSTKKTDKLNFGAKKNPQVGVH